MCPTHVLPVILWNSPLTTGVTPYPPRWVVLFSLHISLWPLWKQSRGIVALGMNAAEMACAAQCLDTKACTPYMLEVVRMAMIGLEAPYT